MLLKVRHVEVWLQLGQLFKLRREAFRDVVPYFLLKIAKEYFFTKCYLLIVFSLQFSVELLRPLDKLAQMQSGFFMTQTETEVLINILLLSLCKAGKNFFYRGCVESTLYSL